MKWRVIVLPRAETQLLEAATWWSENRSVDQAFRWLEGFQAALLALEHRDQPLAVAPENELFDFPFTVHQLTYGLGRHPTHRALLEVRNTAIYVHSIWHLAQDSISLDQI